MCYQDNVIEGVGGIIQPASLYRMDVWQVRTHCRTNSAIFIRTPVLEMTSDTRTNAGKHAFYVRVASKTQTIQSSDWLNIRCTLWRYIRPCITLDVTSFQVAKQTGGRNVNLTHLMHFALYVRCDRPSCNVSTPDTFKTCPHGAGLFFAVTMCIF